MEYFSLDILTFETFGSGIKIQKLTVSKVVSFKCRCVKCGDSFPSHASLQSHIKISHLKGRNLPGSISTNMTDLETEKIMVKTESDDVSSTPSHKSQRMEYFSLDILTFETVGNGIKIQKLTVSKVVSFKCRCVKCGDSFPSHGSLQSHIKISHLQERNLPRSISTNVTDLETEKIMVKTESDDVSSTPSHVGIEVPGSWITVPQTNNIDVPCNTKAVAFITGGSLVRDGVYQEVTKEVGLSAPSGLVSDKDIKPLSQSSDFDHTSQTGVRAISAFLVSNSHVASGATTRQCDSPILSQDVVKLDCQLQLTPLSQQDVVDRIDNTFVPYNEPMAVSTCKRMELEPNTVPLPMVHSEQKPFKCSSCGKRFRRQACVNRHLKTHKKTYRCTKCDTDFKGLRSLKNHMECDHSDQKRFDCSVCDVNFATKKQRQRHMRIHKPRTVPDVKPLPKTVLCPECGKTLQSSNFQNHMNRHEGKRIACPICGKQYSDKSSMTIHTRIHTGVKPYQCNICGKAFSRGWVLVVHKRSHTGEKPYRCQVCGKGFTTSNDLKKHMRTHSNVPRERHPCYFVYDDDYVCDREFSKKYDLDKHLRTYHHQHGELDMYANKEDIHP